MAKRKKKLSGILALWILLVTGCLPSDYETVNATELRELIEASNQHSADIWWYVGADKSYGYFVRKRGPLERQGYRVPIKDLTELKLKSSLIGKYPLNSSERINIKLDSNKEVDFAG